MTRSAQSLDGESMALLTEEGTLYVYLDDSLKTVGELVVNFKLSAEGSAIAYINEEDELILYTIDDQTSKTITDELVSVSKNYYYLSPDGESIAYAEGDEESFTLYVNVDGETSKVEKNAIPLGLSDKAELVYYYSQDKEAVYVLETDESPIKLMNDISADSFELIYNADHTQVFFSSGSSWYISDEGQEKQKISSNSISQFGDYEEWGLGFSEGQNVETTPILNFEEQYFLDSYNTLYYINKQFEAIEVADDVNVFKTTSSCDMIYYMDNYGNLYRGEGYGEKFEQIADDVEEFYITSDGKKCYYVDYNDTLKYVKKANNSQKIADDVYRFYMTHDDYALFITDYSSQNGGTLYASRNGNEKERISDDVKLVSTTSTSTYYVHVADEENTFDIYGATKKIDFSLIVKDIKN